MKNSYPFTLIGLLLASSAVAAVPPTRFNNIAVSGSSAVVGSQTVGSSAAADSKAVLDLVSTTKGMLPPRMTTVQRDAIVSPPTGLEIYNTTTNKKNVYNGTAWADVGTGSGAGGINYISQNNGNPDFETDVTGWSTYDDAAAAPVDGTGGTVTTTFTRTTSSPLRGLGSGLITKDAANRQGEGAAFSVDIDLADAAKVQAISFDYEIASGTYADGDLTIYMIEDRGGTPAIVQPAGYSVINCATGIRCKHIAAFQTSSDSTKLDYRFLIHVASTSASAFTFKIDNVVVGPQAIQYGAPLTDWAPFTPVMTGFGTITSAVGFYRRSGGDMEFKSVFTVDAGGASAAIATMDLPSGASIDTARSLGVKKDNFGTFTRLRSAGVALPATSVGPWVLTNDTGTSASKVYLAVTVESFVYKPALANAFAAASEVFSIEGKVPVAGWSSTVQMSNDTDTRVVALSVTGNPASASSTNPIIFPTVIYDTHGGYNASTGRYTAPVPGYYRIYGGGGIAGSAHTLYVYKNAVISNILGVLRATGEWAPINGAISLSAGDIIDIRPNATSDWDASSYVYVERISGPSAIASNETITAMYNFDSATTVSTGAVANFDTRYIDSHSAVTTGTGAPGSGWKFTAPASRVYNICAYLLSGSALANSIVVYKNGSYTEGSNGERLWSGTAASSSGQGCVLMRLLAGQYIQIARDSGSYSCDYGFISISGVGL